MEKCQTCNNETNDLYEVKIDNGEVFNVCISCYMKISEGIYN